VAIYYLGMKTFGRSRGKSGSRATSAAAYRAGERIRDERTGQIYDHRRRPDVLHKEIVLPAALASQQASLGWARDRSRLWNAAEHAELRGNARVAREFTVALPHELAPAARTQLAKQFAQEIADRYRSAVDLAIHAPRGDGRNFHAHLLSTTREITPDGLGRKTTLELSGTRRHELGLLRWREEIATLRERWADLTNHALESAHVAVRVSHRSQVERGLATPAGPARVPAAAYHMERRGERSFLAEKIRDRYRAQLERSAATTEREPGRKALTGERKPGRTASTAERAHERTESAVERALGRANSLLRARAIAAAGREMMHRVSAGATAAWRMLHERSGGRRALGEHSALRKESGQALALGSSGPAGQGPAHTEERPSRVPTFEELKASAIERNGRADEVTLRSAHNWLVYREAQRARAAAGLGRERASDPERGSERERASDRERVSNREPDRGASRQRGDDFDFGL